jgi:PAS domain S-box-containing protein
MALKPSYEELEEMNRELSESGKKYRHLFETAMVGIYRTRIEDGKFLAANQTLAKLLGYDSVDQLIAEYVTSKHYTDPKRREELLHQIQSKGRVDGFEIEMTRTDGSLVQISISAAAYPEHGYLEGVVTDISSRKQAAEELRENEQRYKSLTTHLNVGVYRNTTGPSGKFIEANPAIVKMFGYDSREEFLSVSVSELYKNPNDRKEYNAKMLKVGSVRNEELQLQRKDGTSFIGSVSAVVVKDENGEVKYYDGIIEDITGRKQAEEALQESEERYRSFLQNFRGIAFRGRMDFTPMFFHGAVDEITGYTEREFLDGKIRWDQVIHPEDLPALYTEDEKRLHSIPHYSHEREYRILCKDGAVRWVHEVIQNVCDDSGKPAILQGAIYDITERKLAEKERENLINELQIALAEVKTLSAISKTVNQSLNLDRVLNDALDRIMELFKSHSAHIRLLDNKTQELVLTAQKGLIPDDLEKLKKRLKLEEAISRHAIKRHEAVIIEDIFTDSRTAGSQSFAERIGCRTLVTIPLFGKNKLLGHLTMRGREPSAFTADNIQLFTSIGHQVGTAIENARLYQDMEVTIKELNETQDNLRQAQKLESIGTLAGGIAHDFNNILSPIMMHSELGMMDLPPDNPVQHNLKEIFKAVERARDMVKQILAFSRKGEGERAVIKITPILKEVLRLLRSSIPTTIDIHQKLEAELDTVFADPTQIHQILMNLCANASHAMQERGGKLTINLTEEHLDPEATGKFYDLNHGPYLKLTVSDTGHGIDAETMDRIFEPYFTTKKTGEGTGMGLAMVHGIVKSYDGNITVESEQGKGTTFNVYLPRIEADVSPGEEPSVQPPTGTERLLLVDDEKAAVDVMQTMLEKLGYKVTARTSSIEALEAFRNNPQEFDLVITDQTMPNMTGKDLARELKSNRPEIPVILCTGFSEQIDEEKAKGMGISAFVMKPIIIQEIAKTIREALDKK